MHAATPSTAHDGAPRPRRGAGTVGPANAGLLRHGRQDFLDGLADLYGELLDVRDRVPVGGHAEEHPPVVGRAGHRQRLPEAERRHRIHRVDREPGRVQRHLRAGHVGDQHVVHPPGQLAGDPGAQRVQRRRGEPAQLDERVGADLLPGFDDARPSRTTPGAAASPDSARRPAGRSGRTPPTPLSSPGARRHRHRHHRPHHGVRGHRLAAGQQPGPQRAGDHGQDDVVHRAAVRLPHPLEVRQIGRARWRTGAARSWRRSAASAAPG